MTYGYQDPPDDPQAPISVRELDEIRATVDDLRGVVAGTQETLRLARVCLKCFRALAGQLLADADVPVYLKKEARIAIAKLNENTP